MLLVGFYLWASNLADPDFLFVYGLTSNRLQPTSHSLCETVGQQLQTVFGFRDAHMMHSSCEFCKVCDPQQLEVLRGTRALSWTAAYAPRRLMQLSCIMPSLDEG